MDDLKFMDKAMSAKTGKETADIYNEWAPSFDSAHMIESSAKSIKAVCAIAFELICSGDVKDVVVMDAGCGTGMLGYYWRQFRTEKKDVLFGVDLSTGMLEKAHTKAVYNGLIVSDLNEPIEGDNGIYTMIVSANAFMDGHCTPQAIVNMLPMLENGGYAIIAMENGMYSKHQKDLSRFCEARHCRLMQSKEYGMNVILVIQKMSTYERLGFAGFEEGSPVTVYDLLSLNAFATSNMPRQPTDGLCDELMATLKKRATMLLGAKKVELLKFEISGEFFGNDEGPVTQPCEEWKYVTDPNKAVTFYIPLDDAKDDQGTIVFYNCSHLYDDVAFEPEGSSNVAQELVDKWPATMKLETKKGGLFIAHSGVWRKREASQINILELTYADQQHIKRNKKKAAMEQKP